VETQSSRVGLLRSRRCPRRCECVCGWTVRTDERVGPNDVVAVYVACCITRWIHAFIFVIVLVGFLGFFAVAGDHRADHQCLAAGTAALPLGQPRKDALGVKGVAAAGKQPDKLSLLKIVGADRAGGAYGRGK
jgi:hypothetical protein